MFETIFPTKKSRGAFLFLAAFPVLFSIGCAVESAKTADAKRDEKFLAAPEKASENLTASAREKNSIEIKKDSPADTVRVFYKNLRAGKFREALFLTNLRPAIEGLTDAELKDLQVDFANLAKQMPVDVEINGEIITGREATVMAKLPDNETDKTDVQQIKLRRGENSVWTILTLDDEGAKIVEKEGKNYLFNLRIETHEREAKKMFDRIAKAQMVFAAQNGGRYGDLPALVAANLLPEDALASVSTGYDYKIALDDNGKSYKASAEPAVYGKTGRLSFDFTASGGKNSPLKSEDRKGQPVKN